MAKEKLPNIVIDEESVMEFAALAAVGFLTFFFAWLFFLALSNG